jgi:hypothetical protein
MNAPHSIDAVLWETIRIKAGDYDFKRPPKREEKPVAMSKYRKDLLLDIRRSAPNGKGDLCTYITNNTEKCMVGIYSRLSHKQMQTTHGIYIKCNNCSCMSQLPWELMSEYCTFDQDTMQYTHKQNITKEDVCDMIEGIENKHTTDDVAQFSTFKMNEGNVMNVGWMCEQSSVHCYNCGFHVAASNELPVNRIIVLPIAYGDYGINKMTLEEFKVCLNLDTPPPSDLVKSAQLSSTFMNNEVSRILHKMQTSHLNTLYSITNVDWNENNNEFETSSFMSNQRLSEQCLGDIETQEAQLCERLLI